MSTTNDVVHSTKDTSSRTTFNFTIVSVIIAASLLVVAIVIVSILCAWYRFLKQKTFKISNESRIAVDPWLPSKFVWNNLGFNSAKITHSTRSQLDTFKNYETLVDSSIKGVHTNTTLQNTGYQIPNSLILNSSKSKIEKSVKY